MTVASKYLHPKNRAPHPVLRRWNFKKERPGVARLECELQREKNGLTFEPAVLNVYFLNSDGKDVEAPDAEPWDVELDEWLLEQGARSTSAAKEAERFGFGLADRLSRAEDRFGDGFFNAVLRAYLPKSDLGTLEPVARMLKHIHENMPQRGDAWHDCQQMIEEAITSVGVDLTTRLQYSDDEATRILGNAIAYYLDERFSVGNRRMLGFLR